MTTPAAMTAFRDILAAMSTVDRASMVTVEEDEPGTTAIIRMGDVDLNPDLNKGYDVMLHAGIRCSFDSFEAAMLKLGEFADELANVAASGEARTLNGAVGLADWAEFSMDDTALFGNDAYIVTGELSVQCDLTRSR